MDVRVSGIVPVHNEATVLGRVLDSIEAQTRPVDELIVVLDRCTDGSERLARSRSCDTVQVDFGNTASALAAGVDRATHPLLVFFDGNTRVPPEYVATLLRTLDEREADLVEWHGGMMALPRATLVRFGAFSTRYLWTLEYFLRVEALSGRVVRLDGPYERLKPAPLARSLRYGLEYAELSEMYGKAPFFRVGTKSGWAPDTMAFMGVLLGHARRRRLVASLRRLGAYLDDA